jgi:DNA-binding transcriptional LysR family regulator
MLDLRHLQALAAVVTTGSVKGAAEQLGYTSSAVSQHISKLEVQTGAQLLEAAGRGVRPTAAGLLLAGHAADLLDRASSAEGALAALLSGEAGVLSMASFTTAGAELVPPALALLRTELPGLDVELRVAEKEEALALLRKGVLDLAVIEDHDDPPSERSDLVSIPLLVDWFYVVLPRGHHLATRRVIGLAQAAQELWVDVRAEINCCRAATDAAFRGAAFVPRRVVQADEYWPAQGFVAAGLGLALIPGLALGIKHEGVVVRPLRRSDRPQRRVLAVTRPSAARTSSVVAMVEALRAQAKVASAKRSAS